MKNITNKCFYIILFISLLFFTINFTHHHDFVGGADEGSYIAMSKLLSDGHRFVFRDENIQYTTGFTNPEYYLPLPFHYDSESGYVETDWMKGYPLLMAVMRLFFGPSGYKIISPLFGALSLLVVYKIGENLCDKRAGIIATLFLGTNWLQIWYSRYPMTETTLQFLLLSSFLTLLYFVQTKKIKFIIISSLALSYAIVVHLSAFLVIPGFLFLIIFNNMYKKENLKNAILFMILPIAIFILIGILDPGCYIITLPHYIINTALSGGSQNIINPSADKFNLLYNILFFVKSYFRYVPIYIPVLALLSIKYLYKSSKEVLFSFSIIISLWMSFFILVGSNPFEPYIGRKLIPIVIPISYLLSAITLSNIMDVYKSKKTIINKNMIKITICSLVLITLIYQLFIFAPFNSINKGEGMPELTLEINNSVAENNSLVILNGPATLFESYLKYQYDVNIISAKTPFAEIYNILEQEIELGKSIYLLDYEKSNYSSKLKENGYVLVKIRTFKLEWRDCAEKESFPNPDNKAILVFDLYTVMC